MREHPWPFDLNDDGHIISFLTSVFEQVKNGQYMVLKNYRHPRYTKQIGPKKRNTNRTMHFSVQLPENRTIVWDWSMVDLSDYRITSVLPCDFRTNFACHAWEIQLANRIIAELRILTRYMLNKEAKKIEMRDDRNFAWKNRYVF